MSLTVAVIHDPVQYDSWYQTPRGAWIGDTEFYLMMSLLQPVPDATLLDVGCGTGYFSQRFAAAGLRVTGIDPSQSAIEFARSRPGDCGYVRGSATDLPFDEGVFDYCAAVTSLCFIHDVTQAIQEMWRVTRQGIVLGLLNRHSLLYTQKHDQGGYVGARWDKPADVRQWASHLKHHPKSKTAFAVFLPSSGIMARTGERIMPRKFPVGGFLAAVLLK